MTITALEAGVAGDVQAAVEAGRQTAEAQELVAGGYYVVPTRHGVERIDLTNVGRTRPARITRHVTVDDVGSFVDYWDKYHTVNSEVYADRRRLAIRAVLDAPGRDDPAWCDHTLTLQLRHSAAWDAWYEHDRSYLGQAEFAQFIEDHLNDVIHPAGAEMLEVAQTLHAHTRVNFVSGYRLVDGQRQLSYVEETTGSAGAKGTLAIPVEFTLGLPVFHGVALADEVRARLRYRIKERTLLLAYALDRATEVVDTAYRAVVEQVADGLPSELPIFFGTP